VLGLCQGGGDGVEAGDELAGEAVAGFGQGGVREFCGEEGQGQGLLEFL